MNAPGKVRHKKLLIALGRPKHFLFTVMNRQRRACGAMSGEGTTDKSEVDCLQCRKTIAFKES